MPTGSAAKLLDQWAGCMRSHGDPNQADPTVDSNRVIQVTLPAGWAGGLRGEGGSCGDYLTAARTVLRGGEPPQAPDLGTALRYAQCMRANGIADYPDPTSNSGNSQVVHATGDLNPATPKFQAASTLCANKTGFQSKFSNGPPQPGDINLHMAGGFGGKPGGNGGSAANSAGGNAGG